MKLSAREKLIRAGIDLMSEKGLNSTGIEEVLELAGIPRGSFYYYFKSKNAFGLEVINAYVAILSARLVDTLTDEKVSPLQRLQNYIDATEVFLNRYEFRRGCLVGNVSQDLAFLNDEIRAKVSETFNDLHLIVSRCLDDAVAAGELSADFNTAEFGKVFWVVWEGVILRARLDRSVEPLRQFGGYLFGQLLPRPR